MSAARTRAAAPSKVKIPRHVADALRVVEQLTAGADEASGLVWQEIGAGYRTAEDVPKLKDPRWTREELAAYGRRCHEQADARLRGLGVEPSEELRRALALASKAASDAEEAARVAGDELQELLGGDWDEDGHPLRSWLLGNLRDARAWRLAARATRRRRPDRRAAPARMEA